MSHYRWYIDLKFWKLMWPLPFTVMLFVFGLALAIRGAFVVIRIVLYHSPFSEYLPIAGTAMFVGVIIMTAAVLILRRWNRKHDSAR